MRAGRTTLLVSLALIAGCAMADQPEATYSSAVHGFSFAVPAPFEVKEYLPEAVSVGQPAPDDGFDAVADIRLAVAGEGEDYPSFEDFALGTLRNMCAADGPGETIHCTEARQRQPFVTASGLEGEVLYMERVHETFASSEKAVDGFGPVFLFDVSEEVPGDGWAALTVQPPANLPSEQVDSALLRQVAESLTLGAGPQGD